MATTNEAQRATMMNGLKEKSGKSLAQWVKIAKASGETKHSLVIKLLKEQGLTYGYANFVAHEAKGAGAGSSAEVEADLVANQYSGAKADLRPIYDAVISAAKKFGSDVEISPKKSYVSLRRSKQFGLIQPSTKTRVDLGINLKGKEPSGALEASGSFNAMVSHRVRLEKKGDFNAAVKKWLKEAYDNA